MNHPLDERKDSFTRGLSCTLWVADSEVASCPTCTNTFTFLRRKHHCRLCGGVFCSACTTISTSLDFIKERGEEQSLSNKNKEEFRVRMCKSCAIEYKKDKDSTPSPSSPSSHSFSSSYHLLLLHKEDKQLKKWNQLAAASLNSNKSMCKLKDMVSRNEVPEGVRSVVWQVVSGSKLLHYSRPLAYHKYLEESHSPDFEDHVFKDLTRTFPQIPQFHGGHHIYSTCDDDSNSDDNDNGGDSVYSSMDTSVLMKAAFNVIKAYSCAYKEFVYSQGMTFIVGLLVMAMEEESAFWIFVKMMKGYYIWGFYKEGTPVLHKCLAHLKQMIKHMVPELYDHLEREDIDIEIVVNQWFLTLFSYNNPLIFVARVWDLFFVHGLDLLVAMSLSILIHIKDDLLEMNYARTLRLPTLVSKTLETSWKQIVYMAVKLLNDMEGS